MYVYMFVLKDASEQITKILMEAYSLRNMVSKTTEPCKEQLLKVGLKNIIIEIFCYCVINRTLSCVW